MGMALVLGALLACKNSTNGTISVDGAAFPIDSCRSGEANTPRFDGVDFVDPSGRRVRFFLQNTGQIRTFLFPAGTTTGTLIGENCGTLAIERKNSRINNVQNIKGTVSANCTGSGHTIVASVNFDNCH